MNLIAILIVLFIILFALLGGLFFLYSERKSEDEVNKLKTIISFVDEKEQKEQKQKEQKEQKEIKIIEKEIGKVEKNTENIMLKIEEENESLAKRSLKAITNLNVYINNLVNEIIEKKKEHSKLLNKPINEIYDIAELALLAKKAMKKTYRGDDYEYESGKKIDNNKADLLFKVYIFGKPKFLHCNRVIFKEKPNHEIYIENLQSNLSGISILPDLDYPLMPETIWKFLVKDYYMKHVDVVDVKLVSYKIVGVDRIEYKYRNQKDMPNRQRTTFLEPPEVRKFTIKQKNKQYFISAMGEPNQDVSTLVNIKNITEVFPCSSEKLQNLALNYYKKRYPTRNPVIIKQRNASNTTCEYLLNYDNKKHIFEAKRFRFFDQDKSDIVVKSMQDGIILKTPYEHMPSNFTFTDLKLFIGIINKSGFNIIPKVKKTTRLNEKIPMGRFFDINRAMENNILSWTIKKPGINYIIETNNGFISTDENFNVILLKTPNEFSKWRIRIDNKKLAFQNIKLKTFLDFETSKVNSVEVAFLTVKSVKRVYWGYKLVNALGSTFSEEFELEDKYYKISTSSGNLTILQIPDSNGEYVIKLQKEINNLGAWKFKKHQENIYFIQNANKSYIKSNMKSDYSKNPGKDYMWEITQTPSGFIIKSFKTNNYLRNDRNLRFKFETYPEKLPEIFTRSSTRNYKFDQGADIKGESLKYLPEYKDNPAMLKNACDLTRNCNGFNTNGYLKNGTERTRGQWSYLSTRGAYYINIPLEPEPDDRWSDIRSKTGSGMTKFS